ncbi:MAG: PIN domain-containing protein [Sphingomonadaceae bacterium]
MVTIDTNIAVYALTLTEKKVRAREALGVSDFLSVQVLNEYANAARRKLKRDWTEVAGDVAALRSVVGIIRPIREDATLHAVRIAERYQLAFYDALMIAVALANGASVLYSEDMQHGLVIDERLTITNPFLDASPA